VGLVQADPVFEISEDRAPDATLSEKHENQNQAKGVVKLMDYIIADLRDEVSSGAKAEISDQTEYEEQLESSKGLEAKLKSKIAGLNSIIKGRLTSDKTSESHNLKSAKKSLKSEVDYKAQIKADCDWMKSNFNGRAKARAGEMDGLVSAKESLAGATLLQVHQAPKESKTVAKVNFLGAH